MSLLDNKKGAVAQTTVLPTPEVESSTWQLVGRKSVDKITGKAFSGVVGPGADGGPTKKKKSKKKADPVEQKGEPEEERGHTFAHFHTYPGGGAVPSHYPMP